MAQTGSLGSGVSNMSAAQEFLQQYPPNRGICQDKCKLTPHVAAGSTCLCADVFSRDVGNSLTKGCLANLQAALAATN